MTSLKMLAAARGRKRKRKVRTWDGTPLGTPTMIRSLNLMTPIPTIPPITARCVELNPRILELVFADRDLTDAEWEELSAYEKDAEE